MQCAPTFSLSPALTLALSLLLSLFLSRSLSLYLFIFCSFSFLLLSCKPCKKTTVYKHSICNTLLFSIGVCVPPYAPPRPSRACCAVSHVSRLGQAAPSCNVHQARLCSPWRAPKLSRPTSPPVTAPTAASTAVRTSPTMTSSYLRWCQLSVWRFFLVCLKYCLSFCKRTAEWTCIKLWWQARANMIRAGEMTAWGQTSRCCTACSDRNKIWVWWINLVWDASKLFCCFSFSPFKEVKAEPIFSTLCKYIARLPNISPQGTNSNTVC